MTENNTTTADKRNYKIEVTPDSLMYDFRGRSVLWIAVFAIIIHVGIIGGFSYNYLKELILGENTSTMSEEELLDNAVREATIALQDIAEKHGVSPQELGNRFAKGSPRPPKTTDPKPVATDAPAEDSGTPDGDVGTEPTQPETPPEPGTSTEPEEPMSAIEQTLQETAPGPELPELPPIEDDLFKQP